MYGLDWNDPLRIRSWQELVSWIDEIGFLPLFVNEIEGFSVAEHTADASWWTGNPEQDPWEWREIIARSGKVAYGKFFGKKAGFISLEWFPVFANYRRDGYDFDSLWDDGLISVRHVKLMNRFEIQKEYMGVHLKREAGFGKDGEKNFAGILTDLQMQTYLVIKDFRRKINKRGGEYGMPVCIYSKPEDIWGYDMVTASYRENPSSSWEKIWNQAKKLYPTATEEQLAKILK